MKKTFGLGPSGTLMGEGTPKICIPIVAETVEEIRKKAEEISLLPAEVVEWRADFYEDIFVEGKLEEILSMLRVILKNNHHLYTFRSADEGGHRMVEKETYYQLNERAAGSGLVDLIDVEAFMDEDSTAAHMRKLQELGVHTIASNHDFAATPVPEEMLRRLTRMQALGADVAKLAVMPGCPQDVLNLLQVTLTAYETLEIPVITMSMGIQGVVSRISGPLTGSALTFATAGEASAPGQIPVEKMREILDIIFSELEKADRFRSAFCRIMARKRRNFRRYLTKSAAPFLYNVVYHKREGSKCTMKFM